MPARKIRLLDESDDFPCLPKEPLVIYWVGVVIDDQRRVSPKTSWQIAIVIGKGSPFTGPGTNT